MMVIYSEMMMILVKKSKYYESLEKFFTQHKFLRRNVPSPPFLGDPTPFCHPTPYSRDEWLKVRDHVLGTQSLVLHPLVGLI